MSPLWKGEFEWLETDPESAKAVAHLVAHAGYTESEDRIKEFIRESGVIDVERTFQKLKEKGVIQEIPGVPAMIPWRYRLRIVTEEGTPYRRRYSPWARSETVIDRARRNIDRLREKFKT